MHVCDAIERNLSKYLPYRNAQELFVVMTTAKYCRRFKRTSLKVLGTVGEPINPEAWLWYHKVIGNSQCSIVDTFWQTETVSAKYSLRQWPVA